MNLLLSFIWLLSSWRKITGMQFFCTPELSKQYVVFVQRVFTTIVLFCNDSCWLPKYYWWAKVTQVQFYLRKTSNGFTQKIFIYIFVLFFFYFSELLPLHPSSGSQEYIDSCCFSVCKGPKGRRVSMHGNIREIVSDTMAGLMA